MLACLHNGVCLCDNLCVYAYVCVCVCVCMHVCVCVYMHVCVYSSFFFFPSLSIDSHAHVIGVLDCVFHPSQPWLFSAGTDHTIRLYT